MFDEFSLVGIPFDIDHFELYQYAKNLYELDKITEKQVELIKNSFYLLRQAVYSLAKIRKEKTYKVKQNDAEIILKYKQNIKYIRINSWQRYKINMKEDILPHRLGLAVDVNFYIEYPNRMVIDDFKPSIVNWANLLWSVSYSRDLNARSDIKKLSQKIGLFPVVLIHKPWHYHIALSTIDINQQPLKLQKESGGILMNLINTNYFHFCRFFGLENGLCLGYERMKKFNKKFEIKQRKTRKEKISNFFSDLLSFFLSFLSYIPNIIKIIKAIKK